jgi:predicted ribosomally synthesized peptide with SipW-like signal peptide
MKLGNRGQYRRSRITAILAGGLVIGVGGVFTLASWTDSEWVHAGNGTGGPGIGTSTFEVQQDASNPGPGTFADFEANPGDALSFGLGALALSPGQTVYAPVALRTTSASIGGTLALQAAVAATGVTATSPAVLDGPGTGLWSALTLQVVVDDEPYTCDASAMTGLTTVIAAGSSLSAAAGATQTLDAAQGNTQYYCFAVTLPSAGVPGEFDGLQGHVVAPAWEFRATSS